MKLRYFFFYQVSFLNGKLIVIIQKQVYANFKGIHGGVYIKIPITIGTIPLTSDNSQLRATEIGFMVNSTESSLQPETPNPECVLL